MKNEGLAAIACLKSTRKTLVDLVSPLKEDQLFLIPEKFKTGILWNLGHLAVSQQRLHYSLASLPTYTDRRFTVTFAKGSDPAKWKKVPDKEEVLSLLLDLPEKLDADYRGGKFEQFTPYDTSAGHRLETIEDSLIFNNFHEGLHMGIIQTLMKFV